MFSFETTLDGSPTLRIQTADSLSEAMHSLKGAFSETAYIYGSAVEKAVELGVAPSVLSMGLGLGYVEIMAAALFLKHERAGEIESFEIVDELRNYFLAWVDGGACPSDFCAAYDDILARTAERFVVDATLIRRTLSEMRSDGRWRVREALHASTEFSGRFSVICFDAFSAKSSPDLWTEEFLLAFFSRTAAPVCVVSTYACTGNLKRSLRSAGFAVKMRQGFSSKRDSTFAVRDQR